MGGYILVILARLILDMFVHIEGRLKDMVYQGVERIFILGKLRSSFINTQKSWMFMLSESLMKSMGKKLMAWIILKDEGSMTEEDVREFCEGKIARYKIPKYYAFVDSVPPQPFQERFRSLR